MANPFKRIDDEKAFFQEAVEFTAEKMGQKYFEVYCGVQGDPD